METNQPRMQSLPALNNNHASNLQVSYDELNEDSSNGDGDQLPNLPQLSQPLLIDELRPKTII